MRAVRSLRGRASLVALLALGAVMLVGAGASALSVRDDRPEVQGVLEEILAGGPIGVVDSEGSYRGTVDQRAVDARDARILATVIASFREPEAPYDAEYEALWESLAILDPVPVLGDGGQVTGHWIGRFVSPQELRAHEPGARRVVEVLLR